MKDIEKIIRENSEFFDSFEPEDGHHDRFLEKQQRRIVKSKTFTISLSIISDALFSID